MVSCNLWVQSWLLNGGLKVVMQIVCTLRPIPPKLPSYVVMAFVNCIGPPWDQSQIKHIPIPPINWSNKKKIPFNMAWELTIHKSQGLTLTRSTIDIGNNEHQGSTFTKIPQTTTLKGMWTIVLLGMLCKDERHFICLTLKKGRWMPPFFVPFTLKIATLNHYTPPTK